MSYGNWTGIKSQKYKKDHDCVDREITNYLQFENKVLPRRTRRLNLQCIGLRLCVTEEEFR